MDRGDEPFKEQYCYIISIIISHIFSDGIPKPISIYSDLMTGYFSSFVFYIILASLLSCYSFTIVKKTKVTLAMAQILCIDGDRSGNFVRIENAIAEAKTKKTEIIVLPESAILGWENPEAHTRAFPIPGEDSDRLCRLAKKYGMHLCIGLDEKEGDKLYDSAILIDDKGNILLKHRKVNVLPELMDPPYSEGKMEVNVTGTKFGTIGVLICADSFVDTLLTLMAEKKPDLLLIPFGWAAPENAWPDHGQKLRELVKRVSVRVNCPVVGADLIGQISHGPWKGQVYGGQSVAYDHIKDTVIISKDRDRDIVVFTWEL
jgi:predicted amidohydrolase